MPCSTEFIDLICRQLEPLGNVQSRKMMGDYVIYLDGKCIITACDNIAFIKKHKSIESLMADAETGNPYPGAKEAYILDFKDMHKTLQAIRLLWQALPYPKSKQK